MAGGAAGRTQHTVHTGHLGSGRHWNGRGGCCARFLLCGLIACGQVIVNTFKPSPLSFPFTQQNIIPSTK